MSLINKMLQDLDARRAAEVANRAVHHEVRPIPQAKNGLPWMRIASGALVAILLAGAGAAWMWWPDTVADTPAPAKPGVATKAPIPPPATTPRPQAPALAGSPAPLPGEIRPAGPVAPPAAVLPPTAPPVAAVVALPKNPTEPPKTVLKVPAASPGKPARQATERVTASGLKLATAIDTPMPKEEAREPGRGRRAALGSMPEARAFQDPDAKASIEKLARPPATLEELAEADYRRAVALMNEGRVGDTLDTLRGALQADPAHGRARLLLAGLLVEQNRLDEAQAVYREGLAQNPLQPQLAMRLARVEVERGDTSGAADTLQKAAAAATGNAEFRGFHAAVLQRLERHREAIAEYRAALALNPLSGVWWMGLAISMEADRQPAQARQAYLRAKATRTLTEELERFVDQRLRELR